MKNVILQRRREEEQQKQVGGKPGSTACVAIFFGPDEEGVLQLITAHAGDSRAVLCRDGQAFRLTEDHKPNSASEQKRIEAAGGQVLASDGIFEVLSDEEVVNLILSRLPSTPQEASQLVVDEAIARGGTDDKTCTVIYFKWRKDLFPPKSEERETEESSGQPDNQETESEQKTQHTELSAVAETQEKTHEKQQQQQLQEETGATPEAALCSERVEAEGEKDESLRGKRDNADCGGGGDFQSARKEKAVKVRSDGDRADESDEAETNEKETEEAAKETVEDDRGFGSKRMRSSGLEEIAAISTGLDVDALIRKRKREMQKEKEEAAAAAAAAAEAVEEDFDIFGGAPAASPKGSDSD
ncbi:hypothetical protein Emed_006374 [Eimeria media]